MSFYHHILLLLLSLPLATASLLSASNLNLCSQSNTSQQCQRQFVVTLAIDGGASNNEQVAFWRSASGDDGQVYSIQEPFKISVAKSTPLIRYPLYYRRNFNGRPVERTIYTGVLQCNDASFDQHPTCGRAYDDVGVPIAYSEGFCCRCDACQLFGLCSNDDRGKTRCGLTGTAAAAACLTFGDLWYSGFDIGPAETHFYITITIERSGVSTVQLIVGPEVLGAVSTIYDVRARLVGNFAAFKQPLTLEHKMLFIPATPRTHPYVQAPAPDEWLFVAKSEVTLDGRECNKVGISYEGFNTQGSRCEAKAGSCLANQLEALRDVDRAKQAKGQKGSYMVSDFGKFAVYEGQRTVPPTAHSLNGLQSIANPYLAYQITDVQASVVTLTFAADNISFIVNVASGRIVAANISQFAANSKDGSLTVIILNTGGVAAEFHVSVYQCTSGTLPLNAKIAVLGPQQIVSLNFDVVSFYSAGQSNQCNISLFDALFGLTDSRIIRFNTTPTDFTVGAQGGDNGAQGVSVLGPPTTKSDGDCTDCPFYNPVCFVMRECFWGIIVQIVIVLVVIAIIVFCIKNRRCLCPCLFKDPEEEAEEREERLRRREVRRREREQRRVFEEMEEQRALERMRQHQMRVNVPDSPRVHPYGSPRNHHFA